MRNLALKQFITRSSSHSSLAFSLISRRSTVSAGSTTEGGKTEFFRREGDEFSYGLKWALAGKGVIVNDKAHHNLKFSELQQKGACIVGSLSGLPLHIRGNFGRGSDISKAQFSKLLKHVTTHLSSVTNIFVHDGALGTSPKCDAKVRIISDSPSAMLSLSSVLWKTSARAISHDSCPLIVYVATSLSPKVADIIGLPAERDDGFIVADIERSSLILWGDAFRDINGTKEALAILSGPIIAARRGIPLSARLVMSGDSVILLFAPGDVNQSCKDGLVSDPCVILSSQSTAPLFQSVNSVGQHLFKVPASLVLVSSDRGEAPASSQEEQALHAGSGTIPTVSKLSPGQAAYHFLAGYEDGKFFPAYYNAPSAYQLELAKALLSTIKDNQISSFLINLKAEGNTLAGKDLLKLAQSTLTHNIPPFEPKGKYLKEKYHSFLSGRFLNLPEELSF